LCTFKILRRQLQPRVKRGWELRWGNKWNKVVVFTPRPSCSNAVFDIINAFLVQNGKANLVSKCGMVQWLGRYRRWVSRHRLDPLSKRLVELNLRNRTY